MAKKTWPSYGSNFSSGTTDAIGVLVETFNDLEMALRFVLLAFMDGHWQKNLIVVEQMSSISIVDSIKAYFGLSKRKVILAPAIEFGMKAFETCRVNRNNIVHFGMATRKEGAKVTRLIRRRFKGGQFAFSRQLKVGDVRRIADECHALKVYLDTLSVAVDSRGKFIEPERPAAPKVLDFERRAYNYHV